MEEDRLHISINVHLVGDGSLVDSIRAARAGREWIRTGTAVGMSFAKML